MISKKDFTDFKVNRKFLFLAKQEESAVKRIKLEYDEMKPNQREVIEVWEMLTNRENDRVKCDKPILLQAIRQGMSYLRLMLFYKTYENNFLQTCQGNLNRILWF